MIWTVLYLVLLLCLFAFTWAGIGTVLIRVKEQQQILSELIKTLEDLTNAFGNLVKNSESTKKRTVKKKVKEDTKDI